jgi:hypothetical protein
MRSAGGRRHFFTFWTRGASERIHKPRNPPGIRKANNPPPLITSLHLRFCAYFFYGTYDSKKIKSKPPQKKKGGGKSLETTEARRKKKAAGNRPTQ